MVGVAVEFGVIVGALKTQVPEVAGVMEQAKLIWLVYEPFGVTSKV